MTEKAIGLLCILLLFNSITVIASQQVGTITAVEGNVQIFTNPSSTADGPSPRTLFEGKYYTYQNAKLGSHVEDGNIVRTLDGGKAKVIYNSGDQFVVSPSSSYVISYRDKKSALPNQIKLAYGSIRVTLEKRPKTERLKVVTKAAVMGVRGTDLYVSEEVKNFKSQTSLNVLRGTVEFQAASALSAAPVPVKKGGSALTEAKLSKNLESSSEPSSVPPKVTVKAMSVQDLQKIQQSTKVKMDPEALKAASPALARKIASLEKSAVQTTLNDIKRDDPKLYAKLVSQKIESLDEINSQAGLSLQKTIESNSEMDRAVDDAYRKQIDSQ